LAIVAPSRLVTVPKHEPCLQNGFPPAQQTQTPKSSIRPAHMPHPGRRAPAPPDFKAGSVVNNGHRKAPIPSTGPPGHAQHFTPKIPYFQVEAYPRSINLSKLILSSGLIAEIVFN
jgi:hypothetical protein